MQDLKEHGPHGVEAAVALLNDSATAKDHCQSGPQSLSLVVTDAHHLRPKGCGAAKPLCNNDTISWIGETRIALLSLGSGSQIDAWSCADAILNCGTEASLVERASDLYLWLPIKTSKQDRSSLKKCLPLALKFLSSHLKEGRKVLVQDKDGVFCMW